MSDSPPGRSRSMNDDMLELLISVDEHRGTRLSNDDLAIADPALVTDSFRIVARITPEVSALEALPLESHSPIELLDAGIRRRELLANELRVHHAKDLADGLLAHEVNAVQGAQQQAAAVRERRVQETLEERAKSDAALLQAGEAVLAADAEVARLRDVLAQAAEESQDKFAATLALPMAELDAQVKRLEVDFHQGVVSFHEAGLEVADVLDVGWQGVAQDILDVRESAARRQLSSRRLRRMRFVGYAALLAIAEFIVGEFTGRHLWGALASALALWVLEHVWVDKALERREQLRQRRELIHELTLHLLMWLDLRFLEATLRRYASQHDVPDVNFVPMDLFADAPLGDS